MFFFLGAVFLIILGVASSKSKPSPSRAIKKKALIPGAYKPASHVNKAAMELAEKHFDGEWLQFLAAKNARLKISIEEIREGVAIGYSRMGTKALECLLLSLNEGAIDNKIDGAMGLARKTENYTVIHQSIFELIKSNQFTRVSILAALNKLASETRAKVKREEDERKAKLAHIKAEQLALKNQIAGLKQSMLEKETDLKKNGAQYWQTGKTKSAELGDTRYETRAVSSNSNSDVDGKMITQSEITKTLFREVQAPSFGVGISETVQKHEDEGIIEVSEETVNIKLPSNDLTFNGTASLNGYPEYDPDQYSLGKKYKKKLNLKPQEIKWLNKFWNYSNVFNSIEGCEVEIIKLYLVSIRQLNKRLKKLNSSLDQEIELLKKMTAEFEKSQSNYWQGYDDVYTGGSAESEVYSFVYKKSESVIREQWQHKRKITATFYSRSISVKDAFDRQLGGLVEEVIKQLVPTIGFPDDTTQILLNEATTTRWRVQFQELADRYQKDQNYDVVSELYRLGKLNERNPSVENVYYEASKFATSFNKMEALKFYIYYIWHDLNSVVVDRKDLQKTIQKKLFANEVQLSSFQTIINELVSNRNLAAALKAVEGIYKTKRKSITLDTAAIKLVEEQHSGTVSKLNEYLQDDDEVYELHMMSRVEAIPTIISEQNAQALQSQIPFESIQLECLRLFDNVDHTTTRADMDAFTKAHSLFKNQLIDGINDACYETLDDVLIEETEDGYSINTDYFKTIIG